MTILAMAPFTSAYATYARSWIDTYLGGKEMTLGSLIRYGATGLAAMIISANCANSRINPANYVPVIGHERQATLTTGDVKTIQNGAVKDYQSQLQDQLKQNYAGLEQQLQQSYDQYQKR